MIGVVEEISLQQIHRLFLVAEEGADKRFEADQLAPRIYLLVCPRANENVPRAVRQSRAREYGRHDYLAFAVIVLPLLRSRAALLFRGASPRFGRIGRNSLRRHDPELASGGDELR